MKYKVFFSLDKKSPVELESKIDDKIVKLSLNKEQLIVEDIDAVNEDEAIEKARKVAEKFLNQFSVKYDTGMVIKNDDVSTEHTDPSTEKTHKSNHISNRFNLKPEFSFQKLDKNGNVIYDSQKPGFVPMSPIQAAAYFRKGKISNDPFDKFRNYFLVVENISSLICQKKKLSRFRELPMIELGLKECFQDKLPDLVNQANEVGIIATNNDIIQKVATFLYKENRCCLNHAKEGEKKKVPFNLKDEESVKKALPLMEYVAKTFLAYAEKIGI